MLANLVLGEVAYVGQTGLDKMYGELVKLLEVVGGVVEVFAPIETQPAQVFLDGADELFIFLGGIRVVEAQMAGSAIFFSDAKVDEGRLGMPDVQLAVRLRREAGDYPTLKPVALHVRLDNCANKIGGGSSLGFGLLRGHGLNTLPGSYATTIPKRDTFHKKQTPPPSLSPSPCISLPPRRGKVRHGQCSTSCPRGCAGPIPTWDC